VGATYSQALAATGGVPPYTWRLTSGSWPAGLSFSTAGVISGVPNTAGTYSFTAQVNDAASNTVTQNFSLAVLDSATLSRAGVISQVAAGGGWDTTIWLVNRSAAPVQSSVLFRGDDGNPLSLPLGVAQPGSLRQFTSSSVNEAIAPNTSLVISVHSTGPTMQGWADVLSDGPVSGYAVFRLSGSAEAAVPLQTALSNSVTLPFDNTGGYTTGVALVNLLGTPAAVTATVWDESGTQILSQPILFSSTDSGGNGHETFMLPDRLPVTTGRRGIVQFNSAAPSPFISEALTGLGLRAGPSGFFTSIPAIAP
jgi:hypothetical protein